MKEEVWKDIKNYEGIYQVSNLGRIRSLKYNKKRFLIPYSNKKGYKIIVLSKENKTKHFQIHKLVINTFKPLLNKTLIKKLPNELFINLNKVQVNHLDNNPANNRIDNLEYCSNAYNISYSQCKSINQYDKNGKFIKKWNGINIAKRTTKINNIEKCLKGKYKTAGGYIWKYV